MNQELAKTSITAKTLYSYRSTTNNWHVQMAGSKVHIFRRVRQVESEKLYNWKVYKSSRKPTLS